MYSEYIIFTASISMPYLNTSDDLVVLTCSNSRFFFSFELPVHILMCWTNGTTLAVKYMIKSCSCRKSDIVIFIVLCIYLTLFRVSGGLSCVQEFWCFF